MATFPEGLTLQTLTGSVDPGSTVSFTIPVWLIGPTDDMVYRPRIISATVDSAGEFTVQLPATDDPQWTPFQYGVRIYSEGSVLKGALSLPKAAGPYDLADLLITGQAPQEQAVDYLDVSDIGSRVPGLVGGLVPEEYLPELSAGSVAWADVTGKPATFPPSAHTHVVADVTGLQGSLDGLTTMVGGLDTALDELDARVEDLEAAPAAQAPTVVRAVVTSGDFPAANHASFTPVSGLTLALPASAGDEVELVVSCMLNNTGVSDFWEACVLVGGVAVRYGSTNTGSPSPDGDPSIYPSTNVTFRGSTIVFGFTVQPGDLDGGNVVFGMAQKGSGNAAAKIYADATWPFRWRAINLH